MPRPGDFLLPVERQVIAELARDDDRQQTGTHFAAFQHHWKTGNHRRLIGCVDARIAPADDPAADVLRRNVIKLPGDLLAQQAVSFRLGQDLIRLHDHIDGRQRIKQFTGNATSAFSASSGTGRRLGLEGLRRCLRTSRISGRSILKREQQLIGIQLLTAGAEDLAHEQINPFAKQLVLLHQPLSLQTQRLNLDGEAGFQGRHFRRLHGFRTLAHRRNDGN